MFRSFNTGKFSTFMKKQGFYIVLILCILAAGAISYFAITGSANEATDPGQDVQKQKSPSLQEQLSESASPSPSATPSATPTPSPSPSPTPSPSPASSDSGSGKVYLAMPMDGEIVQAFSGDTLVYNATLNMWMTHNGIDIAGSEGAEVGSALAGTVESVEQDNTRGWVITISHTGARSTVYSGLAKASVKAGDKVNAGQKLGTLGTPPFEAATGAHLHFEYLDDGVYKDPVESMKK